MPYLLDSNVFIEAHRSYYGFDFCPGFWEWLIKQGEAGTILSIKAVKDEIQGKDKERKDKLSSWIDNLGEDFFQEPNPETVNAMKEVANWAYGNSQYKESAIQKFLGCADYELISYARANKLTVVTLEQSAPESKTQIRIPDVCHAFKIECILPFEMLRREKINLILKD
ncbi:MAG TPA: DUF4411 domain-containing protein [Cyanobacteria bacterium UBA11691]|nr:DUF4411 domain-containing protein [Cyanobacteria bacterium UBA11691]